MAWERLPNGNFGLKLSDEERSLLTALPRDMAGIIQAGDDGSTVRLFPPGRTDDLVGQIEYDSLMRDDLQASHLAALQVLRDTAEAEELTTDQLHSWMRALNQIRLVLGTRLDVQEDDAGDQVAQDDPEAPAWALYGYLGYLQEQVVDALASSL